MKLFGTRSPPFMSSDVIFLQAKWSKIKERVEGWKSGKKMWFKRITVCAKGKEDVFIGVSILAFCAKTRGINHTLVDVCVTPLT